MGVMMYNVVSLWSCELLALYQIIDLNHDELHCVRDEGRGGRDGDRDVQRGELVVLGLLK